MEIYLFYCTQKLLFGAIKIKYKVYIIAETTVLNYKPLSLLLFHYGGLYDM